MSTKRSLAAALTAGGLAAFGLSTASLPRPGRPTA
jgi:hypothetical protein